MSNYTIQGSPVAANRAVTTEGVEGATKEYQSGYPAPLRLKAVRFMNLSADRWYLQVYDDASAPADGTTARFPQFVDPGDSIEYAPEQPQAHTIGLYICASSTAATKTLVATNAMKIEVDLHEGA